jgi:hypothetical protein
MTCERCNTENIDGSQYCDECGASLAVAPRARTQGESGVADNGGPRDRAPLSAPGAGEGMPPAGEHGSDRARPSLGAEPSLHAAQGPRGVPSFLSSSDADAGNTSLRGQEARAAASVASVAAVTPHAKLVIHRGRSVGKEFPMSEDETHIGRWDADGGIFPDVDLDADDPEAKVSRRHARITRRSGQYYIEDLGSTNGTFVNRGRRLLPGDRQPLRDGDEVIVGKTFLRFHVVN